MTVVTSNSMPHYFIAVKYRGPYSDVFGTRGQKQLGVSISSNRSTRIDGMDFQLTPSRQGTIKTIGVAGKFSLKLSCHILLNGGISSPGAPFIYGHLIRKSI